MHAIVNKRRCSICLCSLPAHKAMQSYPQGWRVPLNYILLLFLSHTGIFDGVGHSHVLFVLLIPRTCTLPHSLLMQGESSMSRYRVLLSHLLVHMSDCWIPVREYSSGLRAGYLSGVVFGSCHPFRSVWWNMSTLEPIYSRYGSRRRIHPSTVDLFTISEETLNISPSLNSTLVSEGPAVHPRGEQAAW